MGGQLSYKLCGGPVCGLVMTGTKLLHSFFCVSLLTAAFNFLKSSSSSTWVFCKQGFISILMLSFRNPVNNECRTCTVPALGHTSNQILLLEMQTVLSALDQGSKQESAEPGVPSFSYNRTEQLTRFRSPLP